VLCATDTNASNHSLLAVCGKSSKLLMWRFETNPLSAQEAYRRVIDFDACHNDWISNIRFNTLADNAVSNQATFATGSVDGSVNVWRITCLSQEQPQPEYELCKVASVCGVDYQIVTSLCWIDVCIACTDWS
jgi:hypothetical protein